MALAYVVVMVTDELYKQDKRGVVQLGQQAANQRFAALAQENRLTQVTRNPEPHIMTYSEIRAAFPGQHVDGLVGLRFTADIT